jgi:anti-anti-sigma regulatory factor
MLRIERKTDGSSIVLTVSGRLRAENVDELRQSLERMALADSIVLELGDLILADRRL